MTKAWNVESPQIFLSLLSYWIYYPLLVVKVINNVTKTKTLHCNTLDLIKLNINHIPLFVILFRYLALVLINIVDHSKDLFSMTFDVDSRMNVLPSVLILLTNSA